MVSSCQSYQATSSRRWHCAQLQVQSWADAVHSAQTLTKPHYDRTTSLLPLFHVLSSLPSPSPQRLDDDNASNLQGFRFMVSSPSALYFSGRSGMPVRSEKRESKVWGGNRMCGCAPWVWGFTKLLFLLRLCAVFAATEISNSPQRWWSLLRNIDSTLYYGNTAMTLPLHTTNNQKKDFLVADDMSNTSTDDTTRGISKT